MNDRTKGLLIILTGVLCVCPDAVLVRFLSEGGTDPWVIIFWKLLLSVPWSATYAVYEAGGVAALWKSVVVGRWYYAVAIPVQACVDISFTLAFVFTSAANTLLLINLNPLWCAVAGRLFLGDVLPKRTYIALALALCCMLIIFVPDVIERRRNDAYKDATGPGDDSVKGNIIALVCGVLLSTYITIVRKGGMSPKSINLIGAAALGAMTSSIISAIVRRGDVLPTSYWRGEVRELWQFWLVMFTQGFGMGMIFVTLSLAPKLITGAEIGLALLLEVILGPLLVFFAYGDIPSKWTLIGGSILLAVLALHESRPLFEKAHDGVKQISVRMSSRLGQTTSTTTSQHIEEQGETKEVDKGFEVDEV